MNLIADREDGKRILLGKKWDGRFSLNDEKQMRKLKEYVGL